MTGLIVACFITLTGAADDKSKHLTVNVGQVISMQQGTEKGFGYCYDKTRIKSANRFVTCVSESVEDIVRIIKETCG